MILEHMMLEQQVEKLEKRVAELERMVREQQPWIDVLSRMRMLADWPDSVKIKCSAIPIGCREQLNS